MDAAHVRAGFRHRAACRPSSQNFSQSPKHAHRETDVRQQPRHDRLERQPVAARPAPALAHPRERRTHRRHRRDDRVRFADVRSRARLERPRPVPYASPGQPGPAKGSVGPPAHYRGQESQPMEVPPRVVAPRRSANASARRAPAHRSVRGCEGFTPRDPHQRRLFVASRSPSAWQRPRRQMRMSHACHSRFTETS
jgi:hypothetical protein